MTPDIVRILEKELLSRILQNSTTLGTLIMAHDAYVHTVGTNDGLREAIKIIKETVSNLTGDDDA